MPTGTKLVAGIAFLALALGVVSWWYRFESAHHSTEFWGPKAAELINQSPQVTASTLFPQGSTDNFPKSPQEILTIGQKQFFVSNAHKVTKVPGMVHLRKALLTDSNYDWTAEVKSPRWRWCLLFANEVEDVRLLFSEDFDFVGLLESNGIRAVDCSPMAETLRQYCTSAKLFDASNPAE